MSHHLNLRRGCSLFTAAAMAATMIKVPQLSQGAPLSPEQTGALLPLPASAHPPCPKPLRLAAYTGTPLSAVANWTLRCSGHWLSITRTAQSPLSRPSAQCQVPWSHRAPPTLLLLLAQVLLRGSSLPAVSMLPAQAAELWRPSPLPQPATAAGLLPSLAQQRLGAAPCRVAPPLVVPTLPAQAAELLCSPPLPQPATAAGPLQQTHLLQQQSCQPQILPRQYSSGIRGGATDVVTTAAAASAHWTPMSHHLKLSRACSLLSYPPLLLPPSPSVAKTFWRSAGAMATAAAMAATMIKVPQLSQGAPLSPEQLGALLPLPASAHPPCPKPLSLAAYTGTPLSAVANWTLRSLGHWCSLTITAQVPLSRPSAQSQVPWQPHLHRCVLHHQRLATLALALPSY